MSSIPMQVLAAFTMVGLANAQWGFRTLGGPPATNSAVMAYDAVRGNCVMLCSVGGQDQMWLLDAAGWQLSPVSPPPFRRFAQLVYEPIRGVTVLYGGRGNSNLNGLALDDTWEWDGTSWTLVQPAGTPGGRESYAAAADLGRARIVLYGGIANSWQPVGRTDTYEYDGATWQQVATSSNPGLRQLATACYHVGTGRTVLFGGSDPVGNTTNDETWVYDGVDWLQVALAGPRPAPRVQAQMVYDFRRNVCVLFGGYDPITMVIFNDTWTFDGANWAQVQDTTGGIYPPRTGGAMAMDLGRGRIVHFGGRIANLGLLDETWEYGAGFRTFGTGCTGSNGRPQLSSALQPRLGSNYSISLSNLPANPLAIVATGISNATWQFGSLPMLLTPFGMPNCRAYGSADLIQFVGVSGGTATWTWQVPNNVALVGTAFYQQGIAIDPGINAAGLTVSNAGASMIGF